MSTSAECSHIYPAHKTRDPTLPLEHSRIEEYTEPFKVVDAAEDGTRLRPRLRQPHREPVAIQVRRLAVDLELDLDDPILRGQWDAGPQPSLKQVSQSHRTHREQEGTICEGRSRVRRTCLLVFYMEYMSQLAQS